MGTWSNVLSIYHLVSFMTKLFDYIYMTFYCNIIIILVWTNGKTSKDSWYHNQCFSYSRQGNQHHHPVSFLS